MKTMRTVSPASNLFLRFSNAAMPFVKEVIVRPFSAPEQNQILTISQSKSLFRQWMRGSLKVEDVAFCLTRGVNSLESVGHLINSSNLSKHFSALNFTGASGLLNLCVALDAALEQGLIEGYDKGNRLPRTANINFYKMVDKDMRKKLGWKSLSNGWTQFFDVSLFLFGQKDLTKFTGNKNQIALAEATGMLNLGNLFSVISNLNLADKLEYIRIGLPVSQVKGLEEELKKPGIIKKYKGNKNQIALAGMTGISNLGNLYTALSALGYAEKLQYNQISLPVSKVKKLEAELKKEGSIEKYRGNENQRALAKKAGILNLVSLYSALSALGYVEDLEYNNLSLPASKLKALEEELNKPGSIKKHRGNENQIALAEKVGIVNLGQLFTALSILGYAKALKYGRLELPIATVKLLETELLKPGSIKKYRGNEKQIALAEKVEISNLGQLYTALCTLGFIEKLGYKKISLAISSVRALEEELAKPGSMEKYKGNKNQKALAKAVKISRLRNLFSALSALGYAEKLGHTNIDLTIKEVKKLEDELAKPGSIDKFKGNKNQVALAEKIGLDNLGQLFTAVSSLGYVDQLEYNQIDLSVSSVKKLEEILSVSSNIDKFRGNENQIAFAEEAGIINLGSFYKGLLALGYLKDLEYSRFDLPAARIKSFFPELLVLISEGKASIKFIVNALRNVDPEDAYEEFLRIKAQNK